MYGVIQIPIDLRKIGGSSENSYIKCRVKDLGKGVVKELGKGEGGRGKGEGKKVWWMSGGSLVDTPASKTLIQTLPSTLWFALSLPKP